MALPGVKTNILDRFYGLQRTDLPGGPTLVVIAKRSTPSSSTAPDLQPYAATGEQDVINEYGDGSYAHRAYVEASTAGAPNVVIVPLPSDAIFNNTTASITSASVPGNIFDMAWESIEAIRADIVVGWGAGSDSTVWDDQATPATPGGTDTNYFYADNTANANNSWVKKFGDKCFEVTRDNYPCFAVLGVKGFAGTENATTAQISAGLQLPNLASKETISTGHFVNVVSNEFRPLSYASSWGWASGATTYAAAAARSASYEALTGQPVFNIDRFRYNPTRPQVEALNTKGVVTAATDLRGAMRWVDALTFAQDGSDFNRLTTLRIAFDATKAVIATADVYKGKPMTPQQRAAFETQIGSKLRAMQQAGALYASDYRVGYVPVRNQAVIDLVITPAFELREVILNLSVNF